MQRLRTIPLAVAVLALSGGAALAFSTLPDASAPGLAKATEASGAAVPRRPANEDVTPATVEQTNDETSDAPDANAPDAASHGAPVSAVAKADDATPDTNHGADVSAVARDNHGQAIAAGHKPADAGPPADPGKPDDAGKP
jgi:hypothetical protein